MNNLLEKARAGRASALAGIAINLGDTSSEKGIGARFRTQRHVNLIPFISTRAQNNSSAWLH